MVKDFVNQDGSRLPDATTPPAIAPALLREIPEIEQAVRIFPSWGFKPLLSYGEKTFYEERFLRVDRSFFEIFAFTFLRGNAQSIRGLPERLNSAIPDRIGADFHISGGCSGDFARINWMFFNYTGWHNVVVSAMDENYYEYRSGLNFNQFNVQNFNRIIKNGYGIFSASASDTIRIYVVE